MLKYINPSVTWVGMEQSRLLSPTTVAYGFYPELAQESRYESPQTWAFESDHAYSISSNQSYAQQHDLSDTNGMDGFNVDIELEMMDGVDGDTKGEQAHGETKEPPAAKRGRPLKSTTYRPENAPKRQRVAKSVSDSNDAADGGSPSRTEKRKAFLARNRAAAHKCRQRKKDWADKLQEHMRELQTRNRDLNVSVHVLRNELLSVKAEVLRHGNCNFPLIKEYINNAASHVTPSSCMASVDAAGPYGSRPPSSHPPSLQEHRSPQSGFLGAYSPVRVKTENEFDPLG